MSALSKISPRALAAYLKRGGLIAYPTEYCFGLGCDPRNRTAVKKLLRLKRRAQHKGLILIASRYQQVARYLQAHAGSGQTPSCSRTQASMYCWMRLMPSSQRWS